MQALCQDVSACVRESMCARLACLAGVFTPRGTQRALTLLPTLIELCKDEEASVRDAAFDAVTEFIPVYDNGGVM